MKKVENDWKNFVDKITPDPFDKIIEKCGLEPEPAFGTKKMLLKKGEPTKERGWYFRRMVVALSAAMIAILVWTGIGVFLQPSSVVSLDVNPSISLELNSRNKVIEATALNEDGNVILGDMHLKGTQADVAVNALIGAMLKEGYLNDMENSVLLSVSNKDEGKEEELQNQLLHSIRQVLIHGDVQGAVLSQMVKSGDRNLEKVAKTYHISQGKAALALELSSQSAQLEISDVAEMSVNEIALLVAAKGYHLSGGVLQGTASSKAYIGEERAEQLAFQFSGINPYNVKYTRSSMDYNEGRVTYEVEFYKGQDKYEYEFDAVTEELLEWEKEWKNDKLLKIELEELQKSETVTGIGEEQALEIALENAGVSPQEIIYQEAVPTYEKGQEFYDVDFYTEEFEYEYEIDAISGEILSYSKNSEMSFR